MKKHEELIENIMEENIEENTQEEKEENKPKKSGGKETRGHSSKTFEGHDLTPAEAVFIEEYIKTSNGRQSYMIAYPNSNPKNAHQNAYRLLNKSYIASEIHHRFELTKNASIADAQEIMSYLTKVMRGEIKDQFELDAPLSERTRAAVELAKRQIDIPQKLANNEQPEIKITLDWARPTEAERPKTVREVLGEVAESTIQSFEDKADGE